MVLSLPFLDFELHRSWLQSSMHCSKKVQREHQILVSWGTSFVTMKEQLEPESAGFVPGPVYFSEIEELKLSIMTLGNTSFPLFHPYLDV